MKVKEIAEILECRYSVFKTCGLFIPAHIDRPSYSLISQLGFIPDDLHVDAVEILAYRTREELIKQFPGLSQVTFIGNREMIRENLTAIYAI